MSPSTKSMIGFIFLLLGIILMETHCKGDVTNSSLYYIKPAPGPALPDTSPPPRVLGLDPKTGTYLVNACLIRHYAALCLLCPTFRTLPGDGVIVGMDPLSGNTTFHLDRAHYVIYLLMVEAEKDRTK